MLPDPVDVLVIGLNTRPYPVTEELFVDSFSGRLSLSSPGTMIVNGARMSPQSGSDNGDVMTVEYTQVIGRPVSDVFHFMAEQHAQNHPRWDPNIELEQETDGPIGVGTVIRRRNTRYEEPVEGTMEVVEYEPNEVMATVIREGGFEMSGRITFEELSPSRTRVTRSATVPASVDETLIRSEMERTARIIEDLIESEA